MHINAYNTVSVFYLNLIKKFILIDIICEYCLFLVNCSLFKKKKSFYFITFYKHFIGYIIL